MTLDRAAEFCAETRARGLTVAQCHGCFDLVHPGHIRHLKEAADQADLLLVSITTDASVGKGEGRPLFPEHLRAENLAALSFVDAVCVNTEPTAEGLLARTKPNVYVKGREYESNDDPRFAAERQAVERAGGRVVFTSGDLVFSSTALVRSLAEQRTQGALATPRDTALDRLRSMHALSPRAIEPILARIPGARIVVIGETIIDTYVSCDQPESSNEAPCLSLRPLEQASFDGGASVMARHAAALGAETTLITALPRTEDGAAFVERMNAAGVRVRSIPTDIPMLEKQRFLVGNQKVVKLDRVRPITLDTDARRLLLHAIEQAAHPGIDAAIVADFGNGLLTPHALEDVARALRPHTRVLAGDVSGRRASLVSLRDMDLITPTEREMRDAVQDYESSLNAVVWKLMERTGARAVFTTLSDDGLIAFTRLANAVDPGWQTRVSGEHVPSIEPRPLDPLGCGDALLTASTLALASGASHVQSAFLGAVAAAAESRKLGNHAVQPDELRRIIAHIDGEQPANPNATLSLFS